MLSFLNRSTSRRGFLAAIGITGVGAATLATVGIGEDEPGEEEPVDAYFFPSWENLAAFPGNVQYSLDGYGNRSRGANPWWGEDGSAAEEAPPMTSDGMQELWRDSSEGYRPDDDGEFWMVSRMGEDGKWSEPERAT